MRLLRDAMLILVGAATAFRRLIQDLGRWVRALARWLGEAWRAWVPALAVFLVFIVASQLPVKLSDPVLRFCGLVFQLLGIFTVVVNLRDKRRLFSRPSLVDSLGNG